MTDDVAGLIEAARLEERAKLCAVCAEKMQHIALLREARSSQDVGLWTVFGTFWGTNAILLVALFDGGRPPTDGLVTWVVCGVGFAAALVWIVVQRRALKHLTRLETASRELETSAIAEDKYRITPASGNEQLGRRVMEVCSWAALLGWFLTRVFLRP